MTGQQSPPVVRRVGMRNQQVGIKSGWLWVVYRLWCMNYYERVMLLPYVFRILPVAIFAPSSVHFTCATQGPHPFGAAAMMVGILLAPSATTRQGLDAVSSPDHDMASRHPTSTMTGMSHEARDTGSFPSRVFIHVFSLYSILIIHVVRTLRLFGKPDPQA